MPKPTIFHLQYLIGNPNAYAIQHPDGSYYPVEEPPTPKILGMHHRGKVTIGTYLVYGDKARTLVLDFDSGDAAKQEALLAAEALRKLGVPERSIGIEFSGNKGYHVWVVIGQLVQAEAIRRLGYAALSLAEVEAEVYPKQNATTNLGNLIKLPGGIHRVTGKPNDFISRIPTPMAAEVFENLMQDIPELKTRTKGNYDGPVAIECLGRIQDGVGAGARNTALFHLATMLRRAGLNDANTESVIRTVADKCDPPYTDEPELSNLIESSKNSGPICAQLPSELQCELCPVRQAKGLSLRTGQVKHGSPGELVVVEIGRSERGLTEIKHPDIGKGLVNTLKNIP